MGIGTQTFRGKVAPDTSGVPYYVDFQGVTTPGVAQTIHSFTTIASQNLLLLQINCTCATPGIFKVKIDGSIIASGRTGSGSPNAEFAWIPSRKVDELELLEVVFESQAYAPASNFELYLQARDVAV